MLPCFIYTFISTHPRFVPLSLFVPVAQVTAEGCKNLLLAGVSAVLQDDAAAQPSDIGANFLLDCQDVGNNVRRYLYRVTRQKAQTATIRAVSLPPTLGSIHALVPASEMVLSCMYVCVCLRRLPLSLRFPIKGCVHARC